MCMRNQVLLAFPDDYVCVTSLLLEPHFLERDSISDLQTRVIEMHALLRC